MFSEDCGRYRDLDSFMYIYQNSPAFFAEDANDLVQKGFLKLHARRWYPFSKPKYPPLFSLNMSQYV